MPTQEVLCSEDSPSLNEPWLLPPEGWGLSRKPLNPSRNLLSSKDSKQEINLHLFLRVEELGFP